MNTDWYKTVNPNLEKLATILGMAKPSHGYTIAENAPEVVTAPGVYFPAEKGEVIPLEGRQLGGLVDPNMSMADKLRLQREYERKTYGIQGGIGSRTMENIFAPSSTSMGDLGVSKGLAATGEDLWERKRKEWGPYSFGSLISRQGGGGVVPILEQVANPSVTSPVAPAFDTEQAKMGILEKAIKSMTDVIKSITEPWNPKTENPSLPKGQTSGTTAMEMRRNPEQGPGLYQADIGITPTTTGPKPSETKPVEQKTPVDSVNKYMKELTTMFSRADGGSVIPPDELEFTNWYKGIANQYGLNPDPYNPLHYYDYKSAYKAGVRGPNTEGHWPSQFKLEGHPNLIIDGVDTRTGKPAIESRQGGGTVIPPDEMEELRKRLILGPPTPEGDRLARERLRSTEIVSPESLELAAREKWEEPGYAEAHPNLIPGYQTSYYEAHPEEARAQTIYDLLRPPGPSSYEGAVERMKLGNLMDIAKERTGRWEKPSPATVGALPFAGTMLKSREGEELAAREAATKAYGPTGRAEPIPRLVETEKGPGWAYAPWGGKPAQVVPAGYIPKTKEIKPPDTTYEEIFDPETGLKYRQDYEWVNGIRQPRGERRVVSGPTPQREELTPGEKYEKGLKVIKDTFFQLDPIGNVTGYVEGKSEKQWLNTLTKYEQNIKKGMSPIEAANDAIVNVAPEKLTERPKPPDSKPEKEGRYSWDGHIWTWTKKEGWRLIK